MSIDSEFYKKIDGIFIADDRSERMMELGNIFKVQYSALQSMQKQGFFTKTTNSFRKAFETFVEMIGKLQDYLNEIDNRSIENEIIREYIEVSSAETKRCIVDDAYAFIKAFDNALHGYFNSDRQFLEFPGHHVSLYDLPVKLGMAYIGFVEEIISEVSPEEEFSFLICPEPFAAAGAQVERLLQYNYEVFSEIMKTGEPEKKTQLCLIGVPCDLLFRPNELCFILAHELFHYISRDLRRVSFRNIMLKDVCIFEFYSSVKCVLLELLKNGECIRVEDAAFLNAVDKVAYIYSSRVEEGMVVEAGTMNTFLRAMRLNENTDMNADIEIDDLIKDYTQERMQELMANLIKDYRQERMWELMVKAVSFALEYNESIVSLLLDELRLTIDMQESIETDFLPNIRREYGDRQEMVFYLVKEAVSDVLGIVLLDTSKEAYCDLMDLEIEKLKNDVLNADLRRAQELRKIIVSDVFGWEPSKIGLNDYPITQKSVSSIKEYLEKIKNEFKPKDDNAARGMYHEWAKENNLNKLHEYLV